jgi:hypothetical protein
MHVIFLLRRHFCLLFPRQFVANMRLKAMEKASGHSAVHRWWDGVEGSLFEAFKVLRTYSQLYATSSISCCVTGWASVRRPPSTHHHHHIATILPSYLPLLPLSSSR